MIRSHCSCGCIGRMEAQIERLTADNAALREALEKVMDAAGHTVRCIRFKESEDCPLCILTVTQETFSQPHPGAKLLEELAALRKVAEAARAWRAREEKSRAPWTIYGLDICGALDTLTTQEAPDERESD